MTKKLTLKQQTIIAQLLVMYEMFPSNETELVYHTPFQLLVAVMMSAQATDRQVNVITQTLWHFVQQPQDVVNLGHDKLHDMVRSINYHNSKAKHIYETACILANSDSDSIPDTIDELIKLPGVGIKTAKVVLHVLYGQNWIAADTHVHRVANRLKRVRTTDPRKTSERLEALIPDEYTGIAHHSIILRGRYHCKALKPHCDTCPLKQECMAYGNLKSKNTTKTTKAPNNN